MPETQGKSVSCETGKFKHNKQCEELIQFNGVGSQMEACVSSPIEARETEPTV